MLERFSVGVCMCVYVFMCVCGRNFYPISTKCGTQVGLVKGKVQFEDELGSIYI